MRAGKRRVVYTVKFECDLNLEAGDHLDDALSDINIPEGGSNNSVYCEGSFEVVEIHDPEVDK